MGAIVEYSADTVWALAVRADQINGGYFKEAQHKFDESSQTSVKVKDANKALVRQWLNEQVQPTEQEVQQGRECRKFFESYTLKVLTGKITDFEKTALKISQRESFGQRDYLDLAIVSCLPDSHRRELKAQQFRKDLNDSQPLPGQPGDRVQGSLTVVQSIYHSSFNRYQITGKMGQSMVSFWFGRALPVGESVKIKGKIRRVQNQNLTQLNFVKADK